MEWFRFLLEMVGTVSFAVSGAMLALHRKMDIFGVCVMGAVTACGGGMLRDLFLGALPPAMFRNPVYALTAVFTSIVVFLPSIRHLLLAGEHLYDRMMLITDSLGLGIFTAAGVEAVFRAGYGDNFFFALFLGTMTGVGGGVLRDILAGERPYILIKHVYASAAIVGGALCAGLWNQLGGTAAMLLGCGTIFVIRLLAAHYRWSLPKAEE